jgi:hypothetical protein
MAIDAGESEATQSKNNTSNRNQRTRQENKTCPCKDDNIGRSLCEKRSKQAKM